VTLAAAWSLAVAISDLDPTVGLLASGRRFFLLRLLLLELAHQRELDNPIADELGDKPLDFQFHEQAGGNQGQPGRQNSDTQFRVVRRRTKQHNDAEHSDHEANGKTERSFCLKPIKFGIEVRPILKEFETQKTPLALSQPTFVPLGRGEGVREPSPGAPRRRSCERVTPAPEFRAAELLDTRLNSLVRQPGLGASEPSISDPDGRVSRRASGQRPRPLARSALPSV
jgi:hypothetical protein